ncbi:hypothetical protein [Limnobacter profundi]|uniref:Uncharacterized protein n=1 Tax=Limnobacter profundi TaxID=2732163 RepID=A0ABX6N6J1_9BURK|nr:hypothetical protein [Limnobacter sp. SAORIC-580]QJR30034.1 hypothetical protein HKT17_10105 [Limnobacter sp. SAORIC-580]
MVTYPIHVPRADYRGTDSRKKEKAANHNRIAAELETYINARLKAQTRPIQQYLYHQIASDTGHSVETIRELCFSIDGGHGGFTAFKSGMSAEQAMDAAARGEE